MSSPSPPPYAAANHLGPYLRLPHRLSLAPFAYPIIAVAFVALRFYLSLRSAKNLIGDAKQLVIAGCLGAQKAATAAVSLPRWMALETNEQLVNVGLETIDAARVGLNLSLTAMDKIIVFLIDSYRSFYQCMGEFLIRGGLAAIITISQYVENGLNSLGSQITTAVNAAQSGLNTVIGNANSLFSSVPGFGSVSIPQLSVPVNSLSITVPDTVSSTLTNLNNSLPTLDQLRQDIASLISTPFTLLQGQINDTFAHIENSTFSSDLLPVPAVRTIEFCDGIDLSVIDKVGNKLITIVQDMAIFLVVLVFIMMVGNVILEWYRWRSLQAAVGSISDSWTDPSAPEGQRPVPVVELTHDNILVLQSQLDHGFKTKYLAMFRRKFNLHPRTTNGLSWFFAYVTYPPALMCFLIGVLGLIVVFVQLALIGPLEAEFDNLENLVIGNYTAEIADAINHAITVDTAAYATAVNGWMDTTQNGINNQVFGFVSTASNAINGTVVRFYDDIENGIQSALSGTVFADAVIQFLRCVIGNKILSLEAGLTWLNAHMHISLPHVDPAFLTVKASSVLEMAAPINAAANTQDTSGSDESGILGHIIVAYKDILKGEAILFGVFLGLWFLVVLEACIIMIWHKISDSRKAKQAAAEESHMTKEPEMTEKTASPA